MPALETVPPSVRNLLEWPEANVIQQQGVLPENNRQASAAVNVAKYWLTNVIDQELIPATLATLCIDSEFEGRDTIRFRWTTNDLLLTVAQTGSIFALEITGGLSENNVDSRMTQVRELLRKILVKNGLRHSSQGERITIPRLNEHIVAFNFETYSAGQDQERSIITGRGKTLKEAGVSLPSGPEAIAKLYDDRTSNWLSSAAAWRYWFKNIAWRVVDDSVLLYFLKDESGPRILHFGISPSENKWF